MNLNESDLVESPFEDDLDDSQGQPEAGFPLDSDSSFGDRARTVLDAKESLSGRRPLIQYAIEFKAALLPVSEIVVKKIQSDSPGEDLSYLDSVAVVFMYFVSYFITFLKDHPACAALPITEQEFHHAVSGKLVTHFGECIPLAAAANESGDEKTPDEYADFGAILAPLFDAWKNRLDPNHFDVVPEDWTYSPPSPKDSGDSSG